jgi:phosphoribosylglycinamide formyltransferase-1
MRQDGGVSSSESGFRIVVLASGSGTNLQAIIDQLHGRNGIEIAGVGSDKPEAFALERARSVMIETAVFPRGDYPDRATRDEAMADWIDSTGAELVVLAGYMQLVSGGFVERFQNRIVNVHPALLPSFPGLDAIGQAIEHGVKVSGVTVHFVDEGTDTGPVILQRAVEVPAGGSRKELETAIHAVEHEIYPEAIGMIAQGRVKIAADNPRRVVIDDSGQTD